MNNVVFAVVYFFSTKIIVVSNLFEQPFIRTPEGEEDRFVREGSLEVIKSIRQQFKEAGRQVPDLVSGMAMRKVLQNRPCIELIVKEEYYVKALD